MRKPVFIRRLFPTILSVLTLGVPAGAQPVSLQDVAFQHLDTSHGLSQNGVNSILQDRDGFLWFATRDGLNRYDGLRFKIYRHDYQNPNTLPENQLHGLAQDQDGLIWVGTTDRGVCSLDPETNRFRRYTLSEDPGENTLKGWVLRISVDAANRVWVSSIGGLYLLDRAMDRFVFQHLAAQKLGDAPISVTAAVPALDRGGQWVATYEGLKRFVPGEGVVETVPTQDPESAGNYITSLINGADGRLWLGTTGGVFYLDPGDTATRAYPLPVAEGEAQPYINYLMLDHRGVLWLGADNGLHLLRPLDGAYAHHHHEPGNPRSLSGDTIDVVYEDDAGIVWLGTFTGGVNKFNRASEKMAFVVRKPGEPKGLGANSVFPFYEAPDGDLWVGYWLGGMSRFDLKTRRVVQTVDSKEDDPDSLSSPRVYCFAARPGEEGFWAGTYYGLNKVAPNGEVTRHLHEGSDESNLIHDLVVHEDLLYAATADGLGAFDPEAGTWRFWRKDEAHPDRLPLNDLISLRPYKGRMLLGTSGAGLVDFDLATGRGRHYPADPDQEGRLAHGYVLTLLVDAAQRVWLGTLGGGLNLWDESSGSFRRFTRAHGLANEKIFALAADRTGKLWLGHNRGISSFDPTTETFKNLDLGYNLQGNEYGRGSALLLRDGRLVLGGVNGFNLFDPGAIHDSRFAPKVVLTDVKVAGRPVLEGQDPVGMTALHFSHHDRAIAMQFAALDYAEPGKNRFAYRMDNLQETWVPLARGELTFPRLEPGRYTLRVKGSNHDGVFSEHQAVLDIVVPAPWYRRKAAYAAYLIALGLLIWAYAAYQRHKLLREREINERLRQVDRLKDEFLANTSHELRTPLHGMIGLAESLLDGVGGDLSPPAATNLSLIVQSGKRLESLVRDILDFSKLREQRLALAVRPVDLYSLSQVVVTVCSALARDKDLVLKNTVDADFPAVVADENRLQQVLYNLIGNAVKFTESGGVQLSACAADGFAEITVTDTGMGFDPELADSLFASFQQADGSIARRFGGTGLGLAIARELVQRMGGKIWGTAIPGQGATFGFTLPLADIDAHLEGAEVDLPPARIATDEVPRTSPAAAPVVQPGFDGGRFHVLAVDDEPANRQVLANFLSLNGYRITLAANGVEALARLDEAAFDLVLLDVMMPRMSGFDVIREIRTRFSLQELPVIFLTAKAQVPDMVMGFDLGANDYLTKPFSRDALLSRVRPHLELLDINRSLERKVDERTLALQHKTDELETIDAIVRTMNREMTPAGLLPAIMAQGMALFPHVTDGVILMRDRKEGFSSEAVVELNRFLGRRRFTEEEATHWLMNPAHALSADIYAGPLHVFREEAVPADLAHLCAVVIACVYETRVEGFLVLVTPEDPRRFSEAVLGRLQRFKEHVANAVTRAKMMRELAEQQRDLVETAHFVGMAENARMVLHHMGNSLNSINTSCEVLERALGNRWESLAGRLQAGLTGEASALPERGAEEDRLLAAVMELFDRLIRRDAGMRTEVGRLLTHVAETLQVLRAQDAFSQAREAPEPMDLNQVIQACILAENRGSKVDIRFHLEPLPRLVLPKIKCMHLMGALLRNARRSIRAMETGDGTIVVYSRVVDDQVEVVIGDDGAGVSADKSATIFSQGAAHADTPGGELHHCANLVREMGGTIALRAAAEGAGEEIVLYLPLSGVRVAG